MVYCDTQENGLIGVVGKMKAILMSIKPEWVAKILNGEKTIEVRKRFPKDYRGWVYIYCTKDPRWELDNGYEDGWFLWDRKSHHYPFKYAEGFTPMFNGKVVARFWCDRVYEIESVCHGMSYIAEGISQMKIAEASCLDWRDVHGYLKGKNGYGIHISKLEVFDEPKELSEFNQPFPIKECKNCLHDFDCAFSKTESKMHHCRALTKAPQSWQWIEGE